MEKSLISSPSSKQGLTEYPIFLQTSLLAAPFINLAKVSHKEINTWLITSSIAICLTNIIKILFLPLQQKVCNSTWLHHGLWMLHLLSFFSIFILSAFTSTEIIGAITVLSFILLIIRMILKPISFRFNLIDGLVTFFFITALLSTAFSSYIHTSIIGLGKFSVFFIGYWNFRLILGEKRNILLWTLSLLVIIGFVESIIGIHQYVNHIQPLATWQDVSINPEDQLTRIFGTLKPYNPNLLAGFLIPSVAAGTGLACFNISKRSWIASFVFGFMTLIIIGALILTGSRGGYLSILAMVTMTFLYLGHLLWHEDDLKERYKLKALWIFVLIGTLLASVGVIFLNAPIRSRFMSIFSMREDSSNSYRMNVWASTWQMIQDNWLLGIGPGNDTFKQVYGLYMIPGYNALSAYCIFLEMWVEQGVLGLIMFLLLITIIFLRVCLVFYSSLSLQTKIICGFLLAGIVGSIIYGLFDTIWYRPSVNLLFWLLVAGISVYTETEMKEA